MLSPSSALKIEAVFSYETSAPIYKFTNRKITMGSFDIDVGLLVTPCGLVGRYQSFGETYCLQLLGY
jgi:hypothetical protein